MCNSTVGLCDGGGVPLMPSVYYRRNEPCIVIVSGVSYVESF